MANRIQVVVYVETEDELINLVDYLEANGHDYEEPEMLEDEGEG